MNIGRIKDYDITNGPGVRMSIFVSGCEHFCEECFNQEIWSFSAGGRFTTDTMQRIIDVMEADYVDGVSILGGEPMHPKNIACVLDIIGKITTLYPDKTVWVWTGYTFETLLQMYGSEIFENIAVLVDGKYEKEKRNLSLKYKGSENQRVIDVKKTLETGNVSLWEEKN